MYTMTGGGRELAEQLTLSVLLQPGPGSVQVRPPANRCTDLVNSKYFLLLSPIYLTSFTTSSSVIIINGENLKPKFYYEV